MLVWKSENALLITVGVLRKGNVPMPTRPFPPHCPYPTALVAFICAPAYLHEYAACWLYN